MGSTFMDKQKNTAPPAASKYVNEISGVEQVPVTNEDGSITYVTRALPLSDEDAAKKKELDLISSNALAEIKRLSSSDYMFSESTTKLLDDYQSLETANLNESFDSRKQKESDLLAKRGLSDSTAGNTVTRQTKEDEYDAKKEISQERSLLGEQIKSKDLSTQQNLYSLAQNQLNYDAAKVQSSASSSLSAVNAINSTNLASINDYYNRQLNNSDGEFLNSFLSPLKDMGGDFSKTFQDGFINSFNSDGF